MRRLLVLIFSVVLFVGCSQSEDPMPPVEETAEAPETTPDPPTETIATRPVWIKNAKWETVRTDDLKAYIRASRAIDSLDALNEEIATHNAANPADPWRLYIDTVPSIEDAPMCEMWIVDPTTYALKTNPSDGTPYHLLVARSMVTGRVGAWELDAAAVGGRLYIDYPPPDEIPIPVHDEAYWYAFYSIYAVGSTGLIHYETHITERDWASEGFFSQEIMFQREVARYHLICESDGLFQPDSPWHVIVGQLYTEPE